MSDKRERKSSGCLGLLIGGIVVVGGIFLVSVLMGTLDEKSSPASSVPAPPEIVSKATFTPPPSSPTPHIPAPPETPKATPTPLLTLAQLTRSDFPPSIILKKPNSFESRIDNTVKKVPVPAGTLAGLESIHETTAVVNYNNVRLTVRIEDTDLLERATRQRALNEVAARQRAEQAERERAERDAMERQAAEARRRETELAQRAQEDEQKRKRDMIGDEPVTNILDGSYSAVKTYLKDTLNDPDSLKFYNSTKPHFTGDGWVVGCDYGAKNDFGGMVRVQHWFVIQGGRVVAEKEMYQYNFK